MITINVEENTWEELNKRKKAGESFDEVITRMIREEPEVKRGNKKC